MRRRTIVRRTAIAFLFPLLLAHPACAQRGVFAPNVVSGAQGVAYGSCVSEMNAVDDRIANCKIFLQHGDRGDLSASFVLGELYQTTGDYPKAVDVYNIALGSLSDDSDSSTGTRLGSRGSDSRKLHNLRAALLTALAVTHVEAGQADLFQTDIDGIAAAAWDDDVKNINLCWVHTVAGRELDKALEECGKFVSANPNSSEGLLVRALVQFKLGKPAECVTDSDAALALKPNRADVLYVRGVCKRQTGDAAGADTDVAAALKSQPNLATRFAKYGVPANNAPATAH